MTYQANIPQAEQLISVSQDDLLQNFQAIGSAFPVNHENFNLANVGKHKYVEMPNQASDPAGAVTEVTLFSKLASSVSELHYKRNAEANSYQLTGTNPSIGASPTFKSSTFLPGGLILKFGKVENPTDGTAVTFNTAFSTAVYVLTFGIERNGTSVTSTYYTSLTLSGFIIKTSTTGTTALTYIAIGK